MSSPSSSTPQHPQFYLKDQLQVQRELIQAIDNQYLSALEDLFRTPEWLYQNHPLDRETIKTLCPKNSATRKFDCVFCQGVSFTQSTKAVEHIQQHLGLRPFDCTACQQTFLRRHELKSHARTHAAPDNVPCPNECGAYFTSDKIGNINRHLRERCSLRNAGADD